MVDICGSAAQLPALMNALLVELPDSPEFEEAIDNLAEELRHIHYHIVNTKLFSYVASG